MNRMSRERRMFALTLIPVIFAVIGTGAFFYFSHRRNQEMQISDELRLEVETARRTLARLQGSLVNLEDLPPLPGPGWERHLIEQIQSSADIAGVKIVRLEYSVKRDEKPTALGVVNFTLEVEGREESQVKCLASLQESVTGIKLDTIFGLLGGPDALLPRGLRSTQVYNEKMRITGRVFCELEDSYR